MPSPTSTCGSRERSNALKRLRRGSGFNVTDYVAQDGSNNIAITADVSDPAQMEAMLVSPSAEVQELMEAHGVIQPLTAYIEA